MTNGIPEHPNLGEIKKVQELTQEYASYSRSRTGLAGVLGGVVALVVYVSNIIFGASLATGVTAIVLTIAWLIGKEIIRKKFYRSFGEAKEIWETRTRRFYLAVLIMTVLIVFAIFLYSFPNSGITKSQLWLSLLFVAAMPLIAWRYFRNIGEFMVGVFLLTVCATSSAGGSFKTANVLWLPLIASLMIVMGLIEHRRFCSLKNQLNHRMQEP